MRLDRLRHIVRSQVVADQFVRIDPHSQRPLGREQGGAADTGKAADLPQHVADHEIAQPDLVEAAVGRAQRDNLQHRARRLLDEDALLDHGARQPRLHPFNTILNLY